MCGAIKFVHLPVCAPTAWLHLIGVETPKFELFLKERSTHVGRVVKLSRSGNYILAEKWKSNKRR
jgi:hypothetical protein